MSQRRNSCIAVRSTAEWDRNRSSDMKKSTTQTIFIIVGAVIFLAVLGVGLSALLFMRATEFTKSDEHSADATWDEIRVRFNRASPVIQVQDDETVTVTRRPPTTAPASVQQLQIVAWDPDDNNLVKITLPFWLL